MPEHARAFGELFFDDDGDAGANGCGSERVTSVTRRREARLRPRFGLDDLFSRGDGRDRVAAAEGFAERHDVRHDSRSLDGEVATGAAEAGDHLVCDEKRVVLACELGDRGEPLGRWNDVAGGALHGLDENGSQAAGGFLLELVAGKLDAQKTAAWMR